MTQPGNPCASYTARTAAHAWVGSVLWTPNGVCCRAAKPRIMAECHPLDTLRTPADQAPCSNCQSQEECADMAATVPSMAHPWAQPAVLAKRGAHSQPPAQGRGRVPPRPSSRCAALRGARRRKCGTRHSARPKGLPVGLSRPLSAARDAVLLATAEALTLERQQTLPALQGQVLLAVREAVRPSQ